MPRRLMPGPELKLYVTELDPRSLIVDTVPFSGTRYWRQSSVTSVLTVEAFGWSQIEFEVISGGVDLKICADDVQAYLHFRPFSAWEISRIEVDVQNWSRARPD